MAISVTFLLDAGILFKLNPDSDLFLVSWVGVRRGWAEAYHHECLFSGFISFTCLLNTSLLNLTNKVNPAQNQRFILSFVANVHSFMVPYYDECMGLVSAVRHFIKNPFKYCNEFTDTRSQIFTLF